MREISEETGIALATLALRAPLPLTEYVYRKPNGGPLVFKRVHHFIVEAPLDAALHPDPAEIAEAAWFGFDDAKARLSFKNSVSVLEAARHVLENEPPEGSRRARRRIGPACNCSTPPARRWCPSSRGMDGSGSMSAASPRTTRRTSATPSSITPSMCSTAAFARPASRFGACAMSPMSTTTSCASLASAIVDFRELATEQVRMFDHDMAAIGLLPVDVAPRATEHVEEMVEWIAGLVDGGYAYAAEGWVFFDSGVYPDYGRLSRLDHATMIELSRERGADPDDPRKRHPLDFVLWQLSAPGRAQLAEPVGAGPSRMAHRVHGDVNRRARSSRRHSWRRRRPDLPASRVRRSPRRRPPGWRRTSATGRTCRWSTSTA